MKRLFLLIAFCFLLVGCGPSNSVKRIKNNATSSRAAVKKSDRIVSYATSFEGTRYKYGGSTRKGMDCSGLVYTSFVKEGIPLPRVSKDMAKTGKRISIGDVSKGDLLFFKTGKNKRTINHVGLVVSADRSGIRFIHSTTSKGVIISLLSEAYWKNSFVEVRRVI